MEQRYFRVILVTSPYVGKFGMLKGKVDYLGAPRGWYTLIMPDGKEVLFAGEELVEHFVCGNQTIIY
jgi:hypothetical protein